MFGEYAIADDCEDVAKKSSMSLSIRISFVVAKDLPDAGTAAFMVIIEVECLIILSASTTELPAR